jgi:hypothetical protein
MDHEELTKLIDIEFLNIESTLSTINELFFMIGNDKPDKFQIAAMSKFISDVYNGIENILKRFCKYLNIKLPIGSFYHTELLLMFSSGNKYNCPILFDDKIFNYFKGILKFRHYVIHGYSFQIDWEMIQPSAIQIEPMALNFKDNVQAFLLNNENL